MASITSYGAYIPWRRLDRAQIGKAWVTPVMPGEKAVANYDEDSLTMAVAACIDCLGDMDRQKIDGLFFATTTTPFKEKQAAAIIARAVDLRPDALTADYISSLRGGTLALKSAMDAVGNGSAKQILVVAADCRVGAAQGPREVALGDGAAAILVGSGEGVADIKGFHSIFSDTMDVWRTEEDRFVRSWEDRFVIDKAYMMTMEKAVAAVMADCGLKPKDIAKAVIYSPDPRSHQTLGRALGFDPKTQLQDSLFGVIGNTGTALTLMMLAAALETAGAGQKMLVASYGDGSDALILETTGKKGHGKKGIKGYLPIKKMLNNYEAYARIEQLLPVEPSARPPVLLPSAVVGWRESKKNLALYGAKCNSCGKPQYPAQRVCAYCQSKDNLTPYRFSDKKAKLFTFAFDNLGMSKTDVPPVGGGAINFEGGGRMLGQLTDMDFEQARIDMPMEMTFRKHYQVEGMPVYLWKAKPAI
ncbi:MAG: zinc ribbon domain-containing protein [Dehalococcoidia bacterium]